LPYLYEGREKSELTMHDTHPIIRRLLIAACSILLLTVWGCSESSVGPDTPDPGRTSEDPGSPEVMTTLGSNFVTVFVEATVTTVTDGNSSLGGAVSVGDAVKGFYVFDLNTPDSHASLTQGAYLFDSMPCRMSFQVSGLKFATHQGAVDMDIRLRNDQGGNARDTCDITSNNNVDVLPGVALASIAINLVDRGATALSSDELIQAQTDFADWPTQHALTFSGADGFSVVADVTGIRVPTPRRRESHDGQPQEYLRP